MMERGHTDASLAQRMTCLGYPITENSVGYARLKNATSVNALMGFSETLDVLLEDFFETAEEAAAAEAAAGPTAQEEPCKKRCTARCAGRNSNSTRR